VSRKRGNEKGSPALPAFLRPILWEYEFADMSWEADRDTIVFKILSSGDWNAVRWLRSERGAGQLRQWLLATRGRGLDPARIRFWELVLDLPRRVVEEWLASADGGVWERRIGD